MSDQERLGRIVYESWVEYKKHFENSDSSHLILWEQLDECEKEIARKFGERIAHLALSENNYALSLANIDQRQIIYNGTFSFLREYVPHNGGWCHLLVLKSKNTFSEQMIVIMTQITSSPLPLSSCIQDVATFVMNFFKKNYATSSDHGSNEKLWMTPENTTFVEYHPAGSFRPRMPCNTDALAVMEFEWEEVSPMQNISYLRAKNPKWHGVSRKTIKKMIEEL
jgi:hypothetical protein